VDDWEFKPKPIPQEWIDWADGVRAQYQLDGPVMEALVSIDTIAAIVGDPPSPYDDLVTGIKTLSGLMWTRDDIPVEVRGRMREWIRGACDLMQVVDVDAKNKFDLPEPPPE
jgi:hypothetical protein